MKKIMFSLFAFSSVLFTACNSNNKKEAQPVVGDSLMKDTMQHAAAKADKEATVVPITFTDVDAKAATAIQEITGDYLQIKNALANDNGSEAAAGGKAMNEAIGKLDKQLFKPLPVDASTPERPLGKEREATPRRRLPDWPPGLVGRLQRRHHLPGTGTL